MIRSEWWERNVVRILSCVLTVNRCTFPLTPPNTGTSSSTSAANACSNFLRDPRVQHPEHPIKATTMHGGGICSVKSYLYTRCNTIELTSPEDDLVSETFHHGVSPAQAESQSISRVATENNAVKLTTFDSGEYYFVAVDTGMRVNLNAASFDESVDRATRNFANTADIVDHSIHAEGACQDPPCTSYRAFGLASKSADKKHVKQFSCSSFEAHDIVATNPNTGNLADHSATKGHSACKSNGIVCDTHRMFGDASELADENLIEKNPPNSYVSFEKLASGLDKISFGTLILDKVFFTFFQCKSPLKAKLLNGKESRRSASRRGRKSRRENFFRLVAMLSLWATLTLANTSDGIGGGLSSGLGGGLSILEEGRKLGGTLSGSSIGKCAVNGACFSSLSYESNERCTFTVSEDGMLDVISFNTEGLWGDNPTDYLTIGGQKYYGSSGPEGVTVSAGDEITWFSDYATNEAGFEICVRDGDLCVASSSPSDDGSDGNFYCVNGGVVSGIVGSCTCTCPTSFHGPKCASCPTGYSGTPPDNCIADPCQETSNSSDVGADGNFYCINGGDIGGTTGSCTCTDCDTGYWGENCHNTQHEVGGMTELFDKVSNKEHQADNIGNSIMTAGDSVVLAVGLYKCIEESCAHSELMLGINDLNGQIKCIENNASCLLHGEKIRGCMELYGTGENKLTIIAITFTNGKRGWGGGIYLNSGAKVDLNLCVFNSCRATSTTQGGGAIYLVDSGGDTTVNVYGTRFISNFADSENGDDIFRSSGTITIHNTCPTPFMSRTPVQGKYLFGSHSTQTLSPNFSSINLKLLKYSQALSLKLMVMWKGLIICSTATRSALLASTTPVLETQPLHAKHAPLIRRV